MIAEDRRIREDDEEAAPIWCYLASLGGRLFALPDGDGVVLLPFISTIPQVTPLPMGLVPSFVIGLINVAQRGELLVDLPRLLGMRDGPLPQSVAEGRRVAVVGEITPPENEEYRMAFAVDYGYELLEVTHGTPVKDHELGAYVTELIETPRGEAMLLNMEAVCNTVLREFGAERLWNETAAALEEEDF